MPVSKALEGLVNLEETDFDGLIKEKYFLSEYTEETLLEILNEQMTIVRELKKHGKSKHLANRFYLKTTNFRILIIFDDLVGSSLFSGRKDNPFKKLNTNHRHYSTSMLMVTQA